MERHPDIAPSHPGELVREIVIPGTGKTRGEIAELLGVSRQALSTILNEKGRVTPEMAVRFGKAFGNGPALWVNMQAKYDLWHAERNVDVSGIEKIAV